ncbi:MAG: CDP-glycerol--glycerophosphate glycerophosphotransferase [Lachnospiraceae bacterium]|nr:CDP-glycerol--glycerophosphate glycerophosphotransferase [Lachnospiraceae bacterium]
MNNVWALLYIDPGTGSMLFTIIVGLVSTLVFAFRGQLLKLKFLFTGGKGDKADKNKLPYVIFTDSKRYWNVFKPICDEFERREIEVNYYTASPDDPALSEDYEFVKAKFIGEGNKAYAKMNMLNSTICLSTTPGLDVLQWKRSKDTDFYVHTYHDVTEGLGYRMFGVDFYDAVLLTGEFQEEYIRILEEKRDFPVKELFVTGSTYMDGLLKQYEAIKDNNDINQDRPFTVLLAPSWGTDSILNKYGERILKALVDTGYKIVVRPHPQSFISDADLMKSLQEKFPDNDMFSWNSDNDNFKVMYESDIMITDFSGIIFDYTFIFDRPLIYADTHMDKAPYDASWVEGEVWKLRILPELGQKLEESDFSRMKEIIDGVSDNEIFKQGREKYRNIAWQCKGNSAKLTVDYLENKYKELTDKERDVEYEPDQATV